MLIFRGVFQKYWSYKWIIAWHIKTEPTTAKKGTRNTCWLPESSSLLTPHKTQVFCDPWGYLRCFTIDSSMIRTTTSSMMNRNYWNHRNVRNPWYEFVWFLVQILMLLKSFPNKRDLKPFLAYFLCSVGCLPFTTCCCSAWTHFLTPHCGIALSTAQVQKSQGPGIARVISEFHFPRFQKRKTPKWRIFVHSKPLALPSPNFRRLIPNKSKRQARLRWKRTKKNNYP